jgi:hypothetical protein
MREISDQAFLTAKELSRVPVFKRRLLHNVLGTEVVRDILYQVVAGAAPAAAAGGHTEQAAMPCQHQGAWPQQGTPPLPP